MTDKLGLGSCTFHSEENSYVYEDKCLLDPLFAHWWAETYEGKNSKATAEEVPKISEKKEFDSLKTGDGTWVHFSKGQVLLNEHLQQSLYYTPFSSEIQGHSWKLVFQK